VSTGIGLDGRMGKKFLHPGPGYGGSCFPKDTLALVKTAQDHKSPLGLIENVVESNDKRKRSMHKRILNSIGKRKKKVICILGLTFKPNTDDMRDSPSLEIIPALIKSKCDLKVFDPEGMKEAKECFKEYSDKILWCKDSYEASKGSDALVILTEWNEFRALDLKRLKKLLNRPLIIDLRNIYNPLELKSLGFEYFSLGRPQT
ncbi:MAG: UDP-glucose 6-dehydrogenase, partial [Rickettsiales bacterium]|nr:UDP-glucose 6-dehydrogenase [Rickettsiales bacterium]